MPPSNLSSSGRSDDNQRPRCWKDVELETGFSSYKSYLNTSISNGPHSNDLLRYLNDYHVQARSNVNEINGSEIFLIDVWKDGSTSISSNIQCDGDSASGKPPSLWVSRSDSGCDPSTRLLQILQSSPENIHARIVFWSIPKEGDLQPEIIDALGLGLRIRPPFFEALLSVTRRSYCPRESEGSSFVKIGDSVATIAREYGAERGAPPVLLLAGHPDPGVKIPFNPDKWDQTGRNTGTGVLKDKMGEKMSLSRLPNTERPSHHLVNQYLNVLSLSLPIGQTLERDDKAPLLNAITPLLYFESLHVRTQSQVVQSALLDVQYQVEHPRERSDALMQSIYSDFEKQRFWLRRKLEGLEESRNRFIKYVRSQDAATWLEGTSWLSQDEDIRETVMEARAAEAEARDSLHLHFGTLSFWASKKTIELSDRQIDETKRGKRRDQPN